MFNDCKDHFSNVSEANEYYYCSKTEPNNFTEYVENAELVFKKLIKYCKDNANYNLYIEFLCHCVNDGKSEIKGLDANIFFGEVKEYNAEYLKEKKIRNLWFDV